jgi:hypothetical protein
MIILCTGSPNAERDGERITLPIPSGSGVVDLSLNLHQALYASASLLRAAEVMQSEVRAREVLIPFEKRRKKRVPA